MSARRIAPRLRSLGLRDSESDASRPSTGKIWPVEHVVDLDALADRLRSVIDEWKRRAHVGPLTWRDALAPWPRPIAPDRAGIQVPESLGIRLRKHSRDDAFELVVWAGGWADVGYLLDGEVYNFCPEFYDIDGAYESVLKGAEDFLA